MPIKIIKGDINKIDELTELFELYRVFYRKQKDYQKSKSYLIERITNQEAIIFIAMTQDKAAGFTLCYPLFSSVQRGRILLLNDLFVKKEFRSQGIARMLINRVFEYSKLAGVISVQLETERSNKTAQKLYGKIGFSRDEEHYYYSFNIK